MASNETDSEQQIELNEETTLIKNENNVNIIENKDENTDAKEEEQNKNKTILACFYIHSVENINDSKMNEITFAGQLLHPAGNEMSAFYNACVDSNGIATVDDYLICPDFCKQIMLNHETGTKPMFLDVAEEKGVNKIHKNVEFVSTIHSVVDDNLKETPYLKAIADCCRYEYIPNESIDDISNCPNELNALFEDYFNDKEEPKYIGDNFRPKPSIKRLYQFINDDDNIEILNSVYNDMHKAGKDNPGIVISNYDDLRVPIFDDSNIKYVDDIQKYKMHEIKVILEALDNSVNLFYWTHEFKEEQSLNFFDISNLPSKRKIYFLSKDFDINNFPIPASKNITLALKIMLRKRLLSNLLAGQDNEFNIFRSYYFDENVDKISFAVLAVTLTVSLTTVLLIDIVNNIDSTLEQDDNGIIVISVLIFLCLAQLSLTTINSFGEFYGDKVGVLFDIPWFLIFSDFLLNVIIPIVITLISFFLLCGSETYLDLVLNAFALTFISEIDDMLNVFESDEDQIIETELKLFANYKGTNPYCKTKRKITVPKMSFLNLLLLPFTCLVMIYRFVVIVFTIFCKKETHQLSVYYITKEKWKLYGYDY
eukprot:411537_1